MKISGIYQIQSKCKPERIYIGSAVNITKRWHEHLLELNKNKHHSQKLQRHFSKYRESDLIFTVLLSCPQEDLIKTEQFFLDSYKPYFNGCLVAGSVLGYKHSEESKRKMSLSHKGRKVSEAQRVKMTNRTHSDETKQKISKSQKGKKHPPLSLETRKKMSESRIGRKHSEESRKKMSANRMGIIPWNKGKKMPPISQKTREKMSLAQKGKASPNKGKHPSEETLQRMREAQKGPRPWLVGKKHPPVTEETKQKLRLAWAKRGYTISEETKKKMIGRVPWNKGLSSWNKGKKMSQEARDKMSASKKGKPTGRVPWNKGLKTKNRIKQAS